MRHLEGSVRLEVERIQGLEERGTVEMERAVADSEAARFIT